MRQAKCWPLVLVAAAGCAVGPAYRPPEAEAPAAWSPDAPWRQAAPGDGLLKGEWWRLFADETLDGLVEQAVARNQSLAVAAARLDQARSQVTVASAALLPAVSLGASAARARISAERPLAAYGSANQSTVQNDFTVGPSVSYEFDLFGRIRREVEGYRAAAEQAAADFENTRLVLTAQLVSDYFTLRELDAEIDVVTRSLALERDALSFITSRHDLGLATGLDLAQQQALVDNGAAQAELLELQRAQNEHAIATLVGEPAPGFVMARQIILGPLPVIPAGVPSELLQRRPDVAAAERSMAAANARIGVAKAAYFPSIQLISPASGLGWESAAVASLFTAPSRFWSVGLAATQSVFSAGRNRANVRIAEQDYQAAIATYRLTVLTAMEEVENGITGLAALEQAATHADAGVLSARRAFDIATERYKGGVAIYLDVLTAQQTLLDNQRSSVQIHGQQFQTTVYLIKALGGGWQRFGSGGAIPVSGAD